MFKSVRALALAVACVLAPSGAIAEESLPGVVVELFTSQGCSSCPPADELLARLAERDDVIALALHVDYWDYIGWKDEFAQPKFTTRQRAYARQAGSRMIYTPQMVIAGLDHVIGTRPMELADALDKHRKNPVVVDLSLYREGSRMTVSAPTPRVASGPLIVQLVRFTPKETVEITRGENRGRTITYSNVVRSWELVGEWKANKALDLEIDVPSEGPLAVILQEPNAGRVIAAAQIR